MQAKTLLGLKEDLLIGAEAALEVLEHCWET
jgi:hypothetical protein